MGACVVIAPAVVGRAMSGGGGDEGAGVTAGVSVGVSVGASAGAVGATSTGDVVTKLSVLPGRSAGWLSWAPHTGQRVSPERVTEPQCGQIVPSKTLTSSPGAVTQVGRLVAAIFRRVFRFVGFSITEKAPANTSDRRRSQEYFHTDDTRIGTAGFGSRQECGFTR